MAAGIWFWIIYVICVLAGVFFSWPIDNTPGQKIWRPFGVNIVIFILLGILGWKVFGPPIQ